mmetsp:Transcript_20702/g.48885  ORF Transcript_20702/g.48885 Transcript_20702/m.48885 type:complete len:1171 (+) Transcript_20702:84-3596(+)
MLRVTPLYGSRWESSGASRSGSCTLVEYADVRVLVDVGLRTTATTATTSSRGNPPSDERSTTTTTSKNSNSNSDADEISHQFWESLPPHDCLLLTDSTVESMGSLPLYVEGMRRSIRRRRREESGSQQEQQQQQQEQRRGSFRKPRPDTSSETEDEAISLPIFATFPTVKMGQMSLYDHHANISLDGGRPPYTLEEMDGAIAMLRTIKYSQILMLPLADGASPSSGSTAGAKSAPRLSITAHRAGHVVGGAFYKLKRLRDETSVIVTGNAYHIAKELHLDACTILKNGTGADVLVTRPGGPAFPIVNGLYSSGGGSSSSSKNSNGKNKDTKKKKKKSQAMIISPLASRARRDLTERVLGVLRRDANVLLPVDASGRALELVLLFNQFWSKQNLSGSYNLVWFGSMVHNTLEFGQSQLEWMNSALGNNIFGSSNRKKNRGDNPIDNGQHPYLLKHVTLCTNMAELDKVLAESNDHPTCVLANGLTLDNGPARDLFLRWADNDDNAVIFTDSSQCLERERVTTPRGIVGATGTAGVSDDAASLSANHGPQMQRVSSLDSAGVVAGSLRIDRPSQGLAPADDDGEGDVDHNIEDGMMGAGITEDEASPYTAAYQLLRNWALAKAEDREMDDVLNIDVLIPRRKPLVGNELSAFLEKEEAARVAQRKREEERAMLQEVELAKGRLRLGEDAGANSSAGTGSSGNASGTTAESSVASRLSHLPFFRSKKKSRFDSSLFLKFSKPLHLTFELREDAVGVGQRDVTSRFGIGESMTNSEVFEDDYGIAVLPEQFRDIVTGVDPSKFSSQKDEISKRGLGFASSSGAASGVGSKDGVSSNSKKRNRKDDLGLNDASGTAEDEDDMDERGMEAIDLSEGHGIIRGRNGRPPTKVGTVNRRIEVVAEIDYIPFEGRVDSRAARQSVRALQPRHVVVLGGTRPLDDAMDVGDDTAREETSESALLVDEVRALADAAQSFVVSQRDPVLTPSDSQTAELKVGHNAYPVRLVATPFRTKEERMTEEVVPDPIDLVETNIGNCTVSMLDFVMTGQKVALDGSIVIAPRNIHATSALSRTKPLSIFEEEDKRPPVYVSDGEVLLTDLRTELIAQHGMKAEYSAHAGYSQLIVNGRIVVKKWSDTAAGANAATANENTPGKIDVEGPLCQDFFTVRRVVCNQYVTL